MANHDDHLSYVQDFFLSWGFDVENDDAHISGAVYNRMMDLVQDKSLKDTIVRLVDAVDDQFYLASTSWDEVEEVYQKNFDYYQLQSNL